MIDVLKSPREFPLFAVGAGVVATGIGAVSLLGLDQLPLGVCLFKLVTGFPCLSCGTTRALGHLAHGDFVAALAMNPLFTAGVLVVLILGTLEAALRTAGRGMRLAATPRQSRVLWTALAVGVVLNWAWLVASGR